MTVAFKNFERTMTLEEYQALPEGARLEIIDNTVYDLASPTDAHQALSLAISVQLFNYLLGKSCFVRQAPYDVYLSNKTVVQPDVVIICDKNKRKKNGCHGAPDFVAEILSPSNFRHDFVRKMNLYTRAGVKEYWIVDPQERCVDVFLLNAEEPHLGTFYAPTKLKVNTLENCEIDLEQVFSVLEEE